MSLVFGGILAGLGLATWSDELLDKAAERLFDGAGKRVLEETQARVRAYTGGIPPNHDLEHAIRFAELTSTLVLLEAYRRQNEGDRFDTRDAEPPPFIAAARKWLHDQIGLCPSLRVAVNDELVAELDRVLDQSVASTRREEVRQTMADAQQQVWDDLTAGAAQNNGGKPPAEFAQLFFGDDIGAPGWSITFVAFIREALKKNAKAEVEFVNTRLAAARTSLDRVETKISGVKDNIEVLLKGQEAEAARAEARHAEVMAGQEALVSRLVDAVRAESGGLERETIIKIARRLRPDEMLDFNRAVIEIQRAVEIAIHVIARGERGTNYDAFVDLVLAKVAEKTGLGDFDGGAQAVDEALIDLGRREAEQSDIFRRSRVALLEAGVDQDILRRDPVGASLRIETIVDVEHPDDRPAWSPAFRERYDHFFEEGETKGINFSLSVAIELARRMTASTRDADERGAAGNLLGTALATLGARESGTARLEEAVAAYRAALAEYMRERAPLDWAMTQNNLGNALRALGARESGTARLEAAVAAYRAALKEYTRERAPLQWAGTQNNLGTALETLGERESGTERLEQAVAACRAALKERTRERVPFDWAMTQNNLGNALATLGERESGTARLEQAVAAYNEALKEWTRERVPLRWAATQNNLGTALATLGARGSGTARLEQAVAAFNEALKEWTRERVPLDWAGTQTNLGNALATLGARGSGTARLEQAVAAYNEALKEWTRERSPLQWAATQDNLGNALRALGERESGTARLEEAVAAYRAALEEGTRERVPLDWAMTQNKIGNALSRLGERESGTARLEEAVATYRAALAECTRERAALDWAMTQNKIGNALSRLGERESGTARLEEAVATYRAALAECTRERAPLDWAMTQYNLGLALQRLGERESRTARLEEAVAAYRAALAEYTREWAPLDWAMTQNNLGAALATLGERESGTARLEEAVAAYRAALAEYTRERSPLDWAMSTGNQGGALMVLAARLGDVSQARTGVEQIEVALATMREGGHAPFAAYYEAQLALARALLDRLAGG